MACLCTFVAAALAAGHLQEGGDAVRGVVIGLPHAPAAGAPPRMDVYVAAGRGSAFEFGELTPNAVSVSFHHAVVVSVDRVPDGSTLSLLPFPEDGAPVTGFRVDAVLAWRLGSGYLCTVTFSGDTNLEEAGIAYQSTDATWVQVLDTRTTFAQGHGPAFIVLSGDSLEMALRVFAGHATVRTVQLAFTGPTSGADRIVEAVSGLVTSGRATVSAFAGGRKIGWGCFSHPFLLPAWSPFGRLRFVQAFSLAALDLGSSDTLVESAEFHPLSVTVIHGRGVFLAEASDSTMHTGSASRLDVSEHAAAAAARGVLHDEV